MHRLLLPLLAFACLLHVFPMTAGTWRYVSFNLASDSVPVFYELSPGFSMKMEDGKSLTVSDGINTREFDVADIAGISHHENSSLSIYIQSPYGGYDLEAVPVLVYEVDDAKRPPVEAVVTDPSGKAFITHLDPGVYRIYVDAAERGLTLPEDIVFTHGLNDSVALMLDEVPVMPTDIQYSSSLDDSSGLFSVEAIWQPAAITLALPLPYSYRVTLDDDQTLVSEKPEAAFANVSAGRHHLSVCGLTPGGLASEEACIDFSLAYPDSDFIIRLLVDAPEPCPIADIKALLIGDFPDNVEGMMRKSDENGEILFPALPAGSYSLIVADPDFPDLSYSSDEVTHGYRDVFTALVSEEVISPSEISVTPFRLASGLYSVEITWLMADQFGPFRDYLFTFSDENGDFIGETSETNFWLEDLEPGDYRLILHASSFYGNKAPEVPVEFSLLDHSGVSSLHDDNLHWEYYDLEGRRVNPENLRPGIYIRRSLSKTEKVEIR